MPNGFDVIEGSELLSAWTQGGLVPAEHESQSAFLLMNPAAIAKLRALAVAAKEGRQPPGLVRQTGQDILDALNAPAQAAWRQALEGGTLGQAGQAGG